MTLYFIIIYAGFGLIWLYISETKLKAKYLSLSLFKLILFLVMWPLFLLIRVERAHRIGKFLKPHSKWHLIVKNKVVTKE